MIYLDNAATAFPKAPSVAPTICDFLKKSAGNPGRSGHRIAISAQKVVSDTRRLLASAFGVADSERIVFTLNATDALNLALWGMLKPGDHVVTTSMEHNAVARPLRELASRGVTVRRVRCDEQGMLDSTDLASALAEKPPKLVALLHASNVTGTIQPIAEVAKQAHQHGALLLVDASQTAGVLPMDMAAMEIDLLAFPGHKGLLGPTGTGALCIAPDIELWPMRQGGTGTHSELDRQPSELPEALEAGTLNTVGIAGLGASLRFLSEQGIAKIRQHELALTVQLLEGLATIEGATVYGPHDPERQVAVVSVNIEGWEPVDLAAVLDSSFGIAVRAGLHCAPDAHRTIGTFPQGTVRISPGYFNTVEDIDAVLEALRALAVTR